MLAGKYVDTYTLCHFHLVCIDLVVTAVHVVRNDH